MARIDKTAKECTENDPHKDNELPKNSERDKGNHDFMRKIELQRTVIEKILDRIDPLNANYIKDCQEQSLEAPLDQMGDGNTDEFCFEDDDNQ